MFLDRCIINIGRFFFYQFIPHPPPPYFHIGRNDTEA